MPLKWSITIKKNGSPPPPGVFDPELTNVNVGDQIFWSNNDDETHWPGKLGTNGSIDETYFMWYQIPGGSTSSTFIPGAPGEITYACSKHPAETGRIVVS
jgi:plastocyanin